MEAFLLSSVLMYYRQEILWFALFSLCKEILEWRITFRVMSISWLFCKKGRGGGRPIYLLQLMTISYPPLLEKNMTWRAAVEQNSKLWWLVLLGSCSIFGEFPHEEDQRQMIFLRKWTLWYRKLLCHSVFHWWSISLLSWLYTPSVPRHTFMWLPWLVVFRGSGAAPWCCPVVRALMCDLVTQKQSCTKKLAYPEVPFVPHEAEMWQWR